MDRVTLRCGDLGQQCSFRSQPSNRRRHSNFCNKFRDRSIHRRSPSIGQNVRPGAFDPHSVREGSRVALLADFQGLTNQLAFSLLGTFCFSCFSSLKSGDLGSACRSI